MQLEHTLTTPPVQATTTPTALVGRVDPSRFVVGLWDARAVVVDEVGRVLAWPALVGRDNTDGRT